MATLPPHPQAAIIQPNGGRAYRVAKRALDIAIALPALVICTPLLLVLVLLIRLDSPGPALFRQTRIGYQGRPFTMHKLRTMFHGTSDTLHRLAVISYIHGAAMPAMAGGLFKIEHDPRVTRIGHWLRRWSLDELPQLLDVLRGDMTLVGPRPALAYEVEQYTPYQQQRLLVLPGITGMWQVYGRSQVPFAYMIELDLAYIRQRSFWLDLKLIILTVGVVLSRRGAC